MADTRWSDVVTTALLGTDRRSVLPTPAAAWAIPATSEDPATQILDLAAQHRSWSGAGSRLPTAEPPPTAPATATNWAPAPAQELLGRMLDQPEPEVINYWLAACVDRRRHVWPDHWQLLAELAMASVAYKRLLLARAIGGQGIWFLPSEPCLGSSGARSPPQYPTKQPAPTRCQNRRRSGPSRSSEIDAVFTGSYTNNERFHRGRTRSAGLQSPPPEQH